MAVNAANARAIALDLVIAQALHSDLEPGGVLFQDNDEFGFFSEAYPLQNKVALTGYFLPHRAELGRPLIPHLYSGMTQGPADLAVCELWAARDIADCYRSIRHAIANLDSDDQAAALIVFSLKVSPAATLHYLRPFLAPYFNGDLPAVPHDGNEPELAKIFRTFNYANSTASTAMRKCEALLFFGRGVQTLIDVQGETYDYNGAWA